MPETHGDAIDDDEAYRIAARLSGAEYIPIEDSMEIIRALAGAGLFAPAPLQQEWAAIDGDGNVLMRYGADSHSPHREYGTSLTYSRWASDWKHYDESDGRADQ